MKRCTLVLFVYSISAFGMLTGEENVQPESKCSERERQLFDDAEFAKFWADCTSLFGLKIPKMQKAYPEISDSCMECVVEMTDCGIENCKSDCAPWPFGHGSTSPQCKKCSRDNCGISFDRCTGKTATFDDN